MLASDRTTAFNGSPAPQAQVSSHSDRDSSGSAVVTADPRQLLSSIVHDFNNLLTPVVTILEQLQRPGSGPPGQRKKIDAAIHCTFRAKLLARQLLNFANPQPANREPVDIGGLLELFETALVSALSPDVRLTIATAKDLPPAFIDRRFVERALLNLVLNAGDAMPEGGDIIVMATLEVPPTAHAGRKSPMIRVSVIDCGTGMGDETLRMAGRPNFSTKTNGCGLGLATVRQLMESSGGGFSITSTVGRGTTVDLWLPAMLACFAD
ncbi:ATP-binding protein [Mesorhizobium sp. 43Arga]